MHLLTLLSKRSTYVEFIAVCYVVKNIAKYFDILLLFSLYFLDYLSLSSIFNCLLSFSIFFSLSFFMILFSFVNCMSYIYIYIYIYYICIYILYIYIYIYIYLYIIYKYIYIYIRYIIYIIYIYNIYIFGECTYI